MHNTKSCLKTLVGHKQRVARRLRRPALNALLAFAARFAELSKGCWLAYGPRCTSVER